MTRLAEILNARAADVVDQRSVFEVTLPVLGKRSIVAHPHEKGHYLWLDSFGWHDCSPKEDEAIKLGAILEKHGYSVELED
jgi:hypothetical protein